MCKYFLNFELSRLNSNSNLRLKHCLLQQGIGWADNGRQSGRLANGRQQTIGQAGKIVGSRQAGGLVIDSGQAERLANGYVSRPRQQERAS